jgi:hypothetical protein
MMLRFTAHRVPSSFSRSEAQELEGNNEKLNQGLQARVDEIQDA